MPEDRRIPPEVADHLGYYVYLYVDPRTGKPFYVGKGQGQRILMHLSEAGESRKVKVIADLKRQDLQPRLDVLAHALPSEETALRIEAAVIDLLGLGELTNLMGGWHSIQFGRMSIEDLIFYYAAKPVEVVDPVLLIRINRLYRHGMPEDELYDATRGHWKLGPRRLNARFALAVFEGVVREVYEIADWHLAGTTTASSMVHAGTAPVGRWEFTGAKAASPVRERYFGRSVAAYFPRGLQTPVVYVNCGAPIQSAQASKASPIGAMSSRSAHSQASTDPDSEEVAVFRHRALLINVKRTAKTLSPYDATRYAWKVSKAKAEQAEVILATAHGKIIGAFIAHDWLAATAANFPGLGEGDGLPGRFGFVGEDAPDAIKDLYVGKRVPDQYRKPGAANPIMYTW